MEMERIYRVWLTDNYKSWKDDFENFEDAKKWFDERITTDEDILLAEIVELVFKKRKIKIRKTRTAIKYTVIEEYEK